MGQQVGTRSRESKYVELLEQGAEVILIFNHYSPKYILINKKCLTAWQGWFFRLKRSD